MISLIHSTSPLFSSTTLLLLIALIPLTASPKSSSNGTPLAKADNSTASSVSGSAASSFYVAVPLSRDPTAFYGVSERTSQSTLLCSSGNRVKTLLSFLGTLLTVHILGSTMSM
ncbi:hypothetical protein LINPERPRIM_LOCUS39088 [Linum perenne]